MVSFEAYHRWFYDNKIWTTVTWKGVPCQKFPNDLWMLQEIIWETKPHWVIEVGVAKGGTTCFLADLLGDASRVIAVDIVGKPDSLTEQRFVKGDSVSVYVISVVKRHLETDPGSCMVILDSNHSCDHVSKELELYAPLVTPGQYLIVEDTNLNGNPVRPDFGFGPYEAVQDFLLAHPEFAVDVKRERFGVTTNPGGFLRRAK